MFYNYEFFQIQGLIFLNLFYSMWYASIRPEKLLPIKFFLECNNEFGVILLSYQMMTFTGFVLHQSASFIMGYCFVLTVTYILLINIIFMLKGQYHNYKIEKKK